MALCAALHSHYHSAYKISGKTGEVLWTLGGKNSTFEIGDGANFAWQHFARWVVEGSVLSLFDNESRLSVPPSDVIQY